MVTLFLQEKLKDNQYKAIPLIHITAKTDADEKLFSLNEGAFDYLFKPFPLRELLFKINNIVKLKDAYKTDISVSMDQTGKVGSDLVFKTKFLNFLHTYYTNQDLTIEESAYNLDMSVSTLQRWLNRYFNKNFSDLLKEYRLDKAKLLLLDSDKTIEEISKACGISSLSYFSRIFKDMYHMPPVRFRLENVKKKNVK